MIFDVDLEWKVVVAKNENCPSNSWVKISFVGTGLKVGYFRVSTEFQEVLNVVGLSKCSNHSGGDQRNVHR